MSVEAPMTTIDRKARCHCGSRRQYKTCCFALDRRAVAEKERAAARARREADWRDTDPVYRRIEARRRLEARGALNVLFMGAAMVGR